MALFAFVGALGTVWLVWFVGRLTGRSRATHLLLAGVVVNAFFSAMIMFLTSVANSSQVHATLFWLMGNIMEEGPLVLWISGGLVTAGIVGLYFLAPQLNALSFGEGDARALGINTGATQVAAFAIAALITAVAVSLSGLVGFAGLIVPHGVRLVFGPDHRQLLPLSSVAGAIFLILADTVARMIVAGLCPSVQTARGGPFSWLCWFGIRGGWIGWRGKEYDRGRRAAFLYGRRCFLSCPSRCRRAVFWRLPSQWCRKTLW